MHIPVRLGSLDAQQKVLEKNARDELLRQVDEFCKERVQS